MKEKYHLLIKKLKPFLICSPKTVENFKKIDPFFDTGVFYFNPLHKGTKDFINKIQKLDYLSFGANAMAIEKWVLFDCAMIPGFIYGYSIETKFLSKEDQKKLGVNQSDNEFFPLSMYIAIPTISGEWFGHNLSSLNSLLGEDLSGLGLFTKVMAMDKFKIKNLIGATQWKSPALSLHLKFGHLELLSAFTPNHSKEDSLCYRFSGDDPKSILCNDEISNSFDESLPNELSSYLYIQNLIEEGDKKIFLSPQTSLKTIYIKFHMP